MEGVGRKTSGFWLVLPVCDVYKFVLSFILRAIGGHFQERSVKHSFIKNVSVK